MMKKFDALVAGELNVDLILNNMNTFPQVGKEIISRQMNLTLGSSSAIFAGNLSSMGASVCFAGKIGQDIFGELVIQSLQQLGVNTSGIIRKADLNTGATVVLNYAEDRAMVTHPGAMENFTLEDISEDTLQQCRHLHFSSYFIQPGIRPSLAQLFQKARQLGLTTSFDTQWDPQENWDIPLNELLPLVDIFLPNEKELIQMTHSSSLKEALHAILPIANTVVVKMGNQGSLLCYNGNQYQLPAFINEDVVDAIGAGDSFNAGYIFKFLQQCSPETCQEFGNLMGAWSTTASGGTAAFSNIKNFMLHAKERFGYAQKSING